MGKRPSMIKDPNVLLLLALLAAGAVLAVILLLGAKQGGTVEVRIEGKTVASYPLNQNRIVQLDGVGGTNTLTIQNGQAYMAEADCPDGLCLGMGSISRAGQSIVCLPHKIVVEVKSNDAETGQELDMVAK